MRFRTKDLMITIVPRVPVAANLELENPCLLGSRICVGAASYALGPCQFWTCPRGSQITFGQGPFGPCDNCPKTTNDTNCGNANFTADPLLVNDREDLTILRAELQETLKALDQLGKKLPSGLGTKKNAKVVADALTGVLKEIKKASGRLE